MAKICISYRRADSQAITGRIFDRITAHYGKRSVFMDIDSIPPGSDFREFLSATLSEASVLLAIVGPQWIGGAKGSRERIHNKADPVRVEIEIALRNQVPIIPLLIGDTRMPNARQLPASLKDFVYINALTVDPGADFEHHIGRLLRAIDQILERSRRPSAPPSMRSPDNGAAGHRPEGFVTIRAVNADLKHIKFDIFVHPGMTFQEFLDAVYWQLNARRAFIDEYTYGDAWTLVDGASGMEYLKIKAAAGEDSRPLDEVGIKPGQILDFTRQ